MKQSAETIFFKIYLKKSIHLTQRQRKADKQAKIPNTKMSSIRHANFICIDLGNQKLEEKLHQ
jgi:hypothetical protein